LDLREHVGARKTRRRRRAVDVRSERKAARGKENGEGRTDEARRRAPSRPARWRKDAEKPLVEDALQPRVVRVHHFVPPKSRSRSSEVAWCVVAATVPSAMSSASAVSACDNPRT